MTSRRSGRLTTIEYIPGAGTTPNRFRCRCDCGTEITIACGDFAKGAQKSCGCWKRERMTMRNTTHGMSRSPEYRTWHAMINRCTHPYVHAYERYGGRGIRVCDRWRTSFSAFFADMGTRPSANHSLDRIDPDGHYEHGNCRWATSHEQTRTRRTTRHMTAFGKTQCISDWAKEYNLGIPLLFSRLRKGISLEDALTIPLNDYAALRRTHRHT